MANNDVQKTLDRILGELKSSEPTRCLNVIQELSTLNFSSPAILRELERLAIRHENEEVQKSARQLLGSSVHQFVRSNINQLNRGDRAFILRQIEQWEQDGLLAADTATVIKRRYDFDVAAPSPRPVPVIPSSKPLKQGEVESVPVPAPVSIPAAPVQPVVPAGPRPSLTQTLLSEASIKIYLYLGAFFVIASALILAALVEAARLPILAVATLAFGGTALLLRRRLPQPSFALFIVFSFLLLIDANVLEETLGISETSRNIYWTIVFLVMAIIWGSSVWFYQSRFFSAVAFVSLSLAFYRAGQIVTTQPELPIFLGMLASLAGLAGYWLLRKWKDNSFSLPIFLLAQLQVIGLLLVSFVFVLLYSFFVLDVANEWWLLIALTWLAAASFYALSGILKPTLLFPWLAVISLLPVPWFLLNAFDVTEPAYALGFWAWGTIFALLGEVALRLPSERLKAYHWPLLAGSLILFATAFLIALTWDQPAFTFIIFALTALVYAALHLLRRRWYVWSIALLSALFAYFALFALPAFEGVEVPAVYQFLIATILLVTPELFTRSPLSLKTESRTPAIVLGIFMSVFCIIALADLDQPGPGAVVFFTYAVLFGLHAWHARQEWLGYFATASTALAIMYMLNHFELDLWLPALTLLSVLYYGSGFLLRRKDAAKSWGDMLILSGLVLGALLSITSLVLAEETSGWYMLVIAALFAIEIFARPFQWLELAVEILLSMSLYQILQDFNVIGLEHFLFGASLIWLGGDLIFQRLITQKRPHRLIVIATGALFVLLTMFMLSDDRDPLVPMIYFVAYAVFFTVYMFLQNEPRLGYVATTFVALAVIKFADVVGFEKWIFLTIALAIIYDAVGFWLRRNQTAARWDEMLIYSGLGLGVLTSLAAPMQGGLDSSIPVAIAATLFAAEAFARRNVWWALPANALYLMSYFIILIELNVEEPQFYSIGAALLGMLMHYLLTRAGSKTGAFLAGMLSQLVLLGTTYIQMVSTEKLSFFFILFVQSMLVLVYGILQRSRSLVITPIAFAVIGVMTVVYSALKGLGPVILIGSTGIILLTAGIVAVLMRERITRLGEQLSDWRP